jgi:hypothetical protein
MLRVNSDDRAGQLGLSLLMDAVSGLIQDGDVKWLPDRAFHGGVASCLTRE